MNISRLLLTGILICVTNLNGFAQDTITDQKIKYNIADKVEYSVEFEAE